MIQPSAFDSELLGIRIGKVAVAGLDRQRLEELRGEMPEAGVDLLFIRDSGFAFERMNELSWEGLELADVKVILSRPVTLIDVEPSPEFDVDTANVSRPAELVPLTRQIARRSRFYSCFGEKSAFKLYDRWLENSLARTAADWCFVARDRGSKEAAGIVTVKRDGSTADLPLVATAERFRGKGVLRLLTTAALAKLAAEGVGTCTVGTQLANRTAIRAYEALGFSFESTVVDFHLNRI